MAETACMSSTSARESVHTGAGEAAGTVVAFSQVNKSFGQVKAVSELNLTLHPGETVALLGPNGAGKSTTLDLLLGLRNADSGTVQVFGTTPAKAIAAGQVGAMLQSGGLMEDVTVRELVKLACDLHPKPYPVQRGAGARRDQRRSPTAWSTSSPAARSSGSASRSPPRAPTT